jgi:hypothetical protein
MAVPKTQHFDDSFCFIYEVKNAVRVLEDRELLRLRVGGVAEMTARARRAGIAQLADRFGRKIVRVLLAALRLIAVGPVADDFRRCRATRFPRRLRGSFARPSLLHFRQEFLPAVSASFAHVFHRFTDGVIHPQRLANFGEQRRIIGQFINEIVNLLLERHGSSLARSRLFPQQ